MRDSPPTKYPRFRLPFRNKYSTPSSSSTTGGTPGGSSSISSRLTSSPTFFNLGRKLGFKSATPNIRKSVSFTAGPTTVPPHPPPPQNMDWKKKISTDHTDIAYREAVGRLRAILSPRPGSKMQIGAESPVKKDLSSPSRVLHSPLGFTNPEGRLSSGLRSVLIKDGNSNANNQVNLNNQSGILPSRYSPAPLHFDPSNLQREDDLFGFIEKQSEYINQLEKETKYTRDELGRMLDKVKDVIAENEQLHQKQKTDLLTNMIQHLNEKTDGYGGGVPVPVTGVKDNLATSPGRNNIIVESRVAELEAQLSQARRSLRCAQEDILEMRKGNLTGNTLSNLRMGEATSSVLNNNIYANCDLHRTEIETLNREKSDLLDTMQKLKQMVGELRDRESDAAKKVKNSLEIVEQMQIEKAQSDMETRRLKEELDRHQQRIRDMIQEHTRRLQEEKFQVERKYKMELDQLNNEMSNELDSLTKARLDLERQKRVEIDLRREMQQKSAMVEDIRHEMQLKLGHIQNELANALAQKSSAEQELINSRMAAEKADRDAKQDVARLQAEINGLRKRLEESDVELVKSEDEIAKLNESISLLQRENALAKIRLEGHIAENPELQDADVVTIIQNMEEKHGRDIHELEQLIQQQNGLLDKLRGECRTLTEKLEDSAKQYKKERSLLETERDRFAVVSKNSQQKCMELEHRVQYYSSSHDQLTHRLQKLEEDDKNRSSRIFQLLSKQSGLLRENQDLQNEVSSLKHKLGEYSLSSIASRSVL